MELDQSQAPDPLLLGLTDAQNTCIEVVGAVTEAHKRGPVFQFLEAELDKQGLDASAVIASMPRITAGSFSYGLLEARQTYKPDDIVELTVAGAAHVPALREWVDLYVRMLVGLAESAATASYYPMCEVEIVVDGHEQIAALGLAENPFIGNLQGLLEKEPGTWHGTFKFGARNEPWRFELSGFIRRFRGVADVSDYVARIREWYAPPAATPTPSLSSPLGLAAALDYLSLVWKDRYGAPLLKLPNAERVTRLAFEAQSEAEFDSRMSALREILKDFEVGSLAGGVGRIPEFLAGQFPPDSESRIKSAVGTLQAVKHVRNGASHVHGASQAAAAMRLLGLSYPIVDYRKAWTSVTAYVIDALGILREELQSAA